MPFKLVLLLLTVKNTVLANSLYRKRELASKETSLTNTYFTDKDQQLIDAVFANSLKKVKDLESQGAVLAEQESKGPIFELNLKKAKKKESKDAVFANRNRQLVSNSTTFAISLSRDKGPETKDANLRNSINKEDKELDSKYAVFRHSLYKEDSELESMEKESKDAVLGNGINKDKDLQAHDAALAFRLNKDREPKPQHVVLSKEDKELESTSLLPKETFFPSIAEKKRGWERPLSVNRQGNAKAGGDLPQLQGEREPRTEDTYIANKMLERPGLEYNISHKQNERASRSEDASILSRILDSWRNLRKILFFPSSTNKFLYILF
jgi:hypothetical protein